MGRIVRHLCEEFGSYCSRVIQAWNTFWFTPRDSFALCVIRCLVGWMAFYTTFVWGLELEAFFYPQSFNSAELIQYHFANVEGPYALSFWTWVPTEWMYEVHACCLAITFCFMIGLFTRVTSVLTLIILISYAYRARFATYGLDQINIILTLYLCIGNSGEYFSIDRLFKRYSIAKKRISTGHSLWKLPLKSQASVATNIATRLIQFHYCVIYMAAGLGKLLGETWWDGTAMWRGLANAEYQTFDLTWLAYYPGITEFITHLTIAWEVSFCFLVWRPLTRHWMLLLGVGMHLGIGLILGMWTFASCMIFGYLAFYGPEQIQTVTRYVRGLLFNSEREIIAVNSSSAFSIASAARKKAFDISNRLVLVVDGLPPDDENEQHGIDHETKPAISYVIMLDRGAKLYQKYAPEMVNAGLQFNYVGSLNEMQEAVKRFPGSAVLINYDGFPESEIREFLKTTVTSSLKFHPSVSIIRTQHVHWFEDIFLEDYQRILIQPCDIKDVLWGLHRSFHLFDDQFPEIARQEQGLREQDFREQASQSPKQFGDDSNSYQESEDTVFD